MFDPFTCRHMSLEQKRELVYEALKWSDGATEMLQAWSRQEILQVLCAELGKERKYTGLTKSRMIELLLKIVCENKSREKGEGNVSEMQQSSENSERTPKRQRKFDPINYQPTMAKPVTVSVADLNLYNSIYCKNSACKAKLSRDDVFCKRCSCCICHQYDENKDPSLWLICNSDPPFCGMSCGMSCHLECAFRHENSGISNDTEGKGLDGSFCCVLCGKVNDLLGCWRKQLIEARDTRRVDILCYRLSLGQKILDGTKQYQCLHRIIDEAVKKLEEEMGPLTGTPVKKARGIVNRLSSGPEIQKLCALAVDSLDVMLSNRVSCPPENFVQFEDVQPSSVLAILDFAKSSVGDVTGYTLWHRRADQTDYPSEPTTRLHSPSIKFLISDLAPATNYFLKVATLARDAETGLHEFQFRTGIYCHEAMNLNSPSMNLERSLSPATNCSTFSNPSSVEDEANHTTPAVNADENRRDSVFGNDDVTVNVNLLEENIDCLDHGLTETAKEAVSVEKEGCARKSNPNTPRCSGLECVPFVESLKTGLAVTPCKSQSTRNGNGRRLNGAVFCEKGEPQAVSSSKKMRGERQDKDFEYCVKVIRWLECDGHIETTFRRNFLTWYSMRATSQDVRIVKVFVETFIEDPSSLAGQLVDTFDEIVSNKRCSMVQPGFCSKLWH